MKSKTQINWIKLPSVTRTGKSFYRGSSADTTYTITQSFLTDLWSVGDSHGGSWGQFKTAQDAKNAVESM